MDILTCVEINRLDDITGFLNPVPEEYQVDEKDIEQLHRQMLADENVISYKVYNVLCEIGHDGFITEDKIEDTSHTYWIAEQKNDVQHVGKHEYIAIIWSHTVELTDKETVFLRNGTVLWSKTPEEKKRQDLEASVSKRQQQLRSYLKFRKP